MPSDLFSIDGKTALITGGSRGIGLMIARGFVQAGTRVYISSRNTEACDAVAAELGERCIAIPADLSQMDEVSRLAGELANREPALHILVNNAGAAWGAAFEEYPESGYDKVMDVNVKAIFFLTQKLIPLLRKAGAPDDPARVINIGSIDGLRVPWFENFAYSASKAAVHMLTRHLAHTFVGEHINVNAIAPGLFPSKMTKWVFENAEEQALEAVPMKRAGTWEDIAGTAIFLSSRAGSYLTGAVIPVDGGVSTR